MHYKIWAVVEEIDESDAESPIYEDISEPHCVGRFDTKKEAIDALEAMED